MAARSEHGGEFGLTHPAHEYAAETATGLRSCADAYAHPVSPSPLPSETNASTGRAGRPDQTQGCVRSGHSTPIDSAAGIPSEVLNASRLPFNPPCSSEAAGGLTPGLEVARGHGLKVQASGLGDGRAGPGADRGSRQDSRHAAAGHRGVGVTSCDRGSCVHRLFLT